MLERNYAENINLHPDSSVRFEDLFDIDEIQKMQDLFAEATGVASIITRPDGSPITHPSKFCKLCQLIRSTYKGEINCFRSDAEIGKVNLDGPTIRPCLSGGLWDGGSSITVDGIHIANWLIGQVRNDTQSEEKMLDYCMEIGADPDKFMKAYSEVEVMSTDQFKGICDFLFIFANQLSRTAYQNYRQEQIIRAREKAEKELAKAKSYIDNIINSMPSVLIGVDKNLEVTQWNLGARAATGIDSNQAIGRRLSELLPRLEEEVGNIRNVISMRKISRKTDVIHSTEDNKTNHENITIYPLVTNGVDGAVIRIDDITEYIEMEQQLAHSRKMDAIGQLAGGIAHDFNNMLGGIVGSADMLKRRTSNEKDRQMTDVILKAALRASDLTSKLLAFGRKGKAVSSPVDMIKVIDDTVELLERSMDKKIEINVSLNARNSQVIGDDSLLQNALLNIGINSGHAMPDGGKLNFHTCNVKLDSIYCNNSRFNIIPGNYLEIEIRDTGCGISPENIDRIFEPFFTTRSQGEGTGLGLAAVYGTIQEHHGAITVYSEVDEGTVFHIYLPLAEAENQDYNLHSDKPVAGTGVILVVDDEELIGITAKAMLEELNYDVILASDGLEAIEIYEKHSKDISAVILDMIMPKMNGRETFFKLKKIDPEVKVIITSGFSENKNVGDMIENGVRGFIRKPYLQAELSKLLANVLSHK